MEFERALDVRLASPIEPPIALLSAARARVVEHTAGGARLSWTDRILGRTIMRKTLVSGTAVAVLFAVAFALLPRGAQGATARETFRQMKAAIVASKQAMEVQVAVTMTEDNNVHAQVSAPGGAGPLDVGVAVQREGQTLHVTAHVSFDESNFSKIAFGKTKNTLVLTPKKQADRKYEVVLDGKSKLPLTWTEFVKDGKTWKETCRDKFVYTPKKGTAAKAG
jgi:hypothetical protein